MKVEAATVDEYIAGVPEERRPAMETLRALCLDELAGFDEGLEYGMPSYSRDGNVEVAFASQKNYISLYVMEGAVKDNAHLLDGLSVGKSCIRYRRPGQIDPNTVRVLLATTASAAGPVS